MTVLDSTPLSDLELLSFTHDASSDAIRLAAEQLRFSKTDIRTGTVVDAAAYLATNPSPHTLLIEVTSAEAAPQELDALADVLNPATRVIVCGKIDSVRFYHWLLEIGIHEYLLEPFTESELVQALRMEPEAKPATSDVAPKMQKMIAVMGARGGVGTTSIAVNIAALFARSHGIDTALFDLDPYFGSAALALDIEPGRGLRDALEKPERVDGLFLDRVMAKPFGKLSVLSGEEPFAQVLHPHATGGETVLATMRQKFPMVVVDVPRQMNPLSRYVLAHADHVIIVAEPQLGALRDALRIKDYVMDGLKRPAPLLLLNRVGMVKGHELPIKEFAKHYGAAPDLQIPYLMEAAAANADGKLLIDQPKIQPSLEPLRQIVATLAGVDTASSSASAATKPRSLLAKLSGKGGNA